MKKLYFKTLILFNDLSFIGHDKYVCKSCEKQPLVTPNHRAVSYIGRLGLKIRNKKMFRKLLLQVLCEW